MKNIIYSGIILLLIFGFCFADEFATTDSGKRVFLKSDGTWQAISNEQEEEKLISNKISEALNNMEKMPSDFDEVTYYINKSTLAFNSYHNDIIYLFIAKEETAKPSLVLVINKVYSGKWLFTNRYIIETDNKIFYMVPEDNKIKRGYDSSKMWEVFTAEVDEKIFEIIKAIVNSDRAVIRYQGEKQTHDREISDDEKADMQEVLYAYEALGGDYNF